MATLFDSASLVMIPSGYKDDKLYSIKPTNGDGDFTFSRDGAGASPATRVNASGLIEKGRENVILQSNQFDTTWVNSNTTETGGQSGYDGSSDAWQLTAASAGSSRIIGQNNTTTGVSTFSVYAKAGNINYLALENGTDFAYISLIDGSVGNSGGTNYIAYSSTDVGGGWWRVSITFNKVASSDLRIYLASSGTSTAVNSGDYIYIQDAQLEQGLVATDYIETTTAPVSAGLLGDMPRLDYSGGATCPSLLLEPSRVNHYYQSEYFSTGSRVVFTPNAITSPEGVSNATSVVATSVNGSHEATLSPLISIANTNPRTFSIYAKYNGNHLILNVAGSSINWTACIFDLENGVAKTPQQFGAQTACTADIEDAGNGWYRCSITYTPYVSGGFLHLVSLTDDVDATLVAYGADEYVGDDVSGIYIYGSQVEEGSYPTSYIPTYGSASTRGADVAVKTGVSSLIGQTEGTLYFEGVRPDGGNDYSAFGVSDGTTDNEVWFRFTAADTIEFYLRSGGGQSVGYTYTGADLNQNTKIAFAYKANDVAVYVNGNLVLSDNSVVVPASLTQVSFYIVRGANQFNMIASVKQALLFKTRLTNAELASLTTL